MNSYKEYSAIKNLIEEYFNLKEGHRYEDFTRRLVDILNI